MKKVIIFLLLLVTLSATSCDDKKAREYAAKLIPVLDSYQQQISQKIKAERESYYELADAYDEARKIDIKLKLEFERNRRAEAAGERLAGSSNIKLSQILDSMQEYARYDFETTQTLLQESLDSRSQYLVNLESLEIELQKIGALREALQDLAKEKSDFKKFKLAAEFALQTDAEINKLLCTDLSRQLADLNSALASASGEERVRIQREIRRLRERMTAKACS